MLISPKWQTMWMESQHCSKSIMNMPLPSQQAEQILNDLRTQCCSPNKAIQLEALKCWGMWIHNQKPDDWKLNTVCFAAVRPLISKKLQPLHKDVDICTMKLSLMWALIVKVQSIIHLEGPQYILEVFLQSCLTWLSSANGDGCENEVSSLIFQLLLCIFNKNEIPSSIDKEMFPPLTADVLHSKKIFHRLAEEFLKVFLHWRKCQEKTVILKLWKHFLEHCELSCEHVPVPVWHKIFKLAGQICSEKSEPVKERLAFLHGCVTTLESAVSSSKFIDFGNLLTTPCEAFLKKLIELCCVVGRDECCDLEMFHHAKEICQVLAIKSVALGGYVLCISVLDVLEEFWLRDLYWGVWCGLVHCYKTLLNDVDKSQYTKVQTKFYRKLRGVAVNFELDRNNLHKDCVSEVEKNISVLNISCMCTTPSLKNTLDSSRKETSLELMKANSHFEILPESQTSEEISKQIVPLPTARFYGSFSNVSLYKRALPRKAVILNFDLIKDILRTIGINFPKSVLNSWLTFRIVTLQTGRPEETVRPLLNLSLQLKPTTESEENMKLAVSCFKAKTPSPVPECVPERKNNQRDEEVDEDTISTPLTRSRKRAEEEKEREFERQTRRKRKSFELVVQEILKKNKERKTEKNSRRQSPVTQKGKRNKKKLRKAEKKSESRPSEVISERKLRNSKKEEPKKEKKLKKTDGKLENYFKVLSKKPEKEVKKQENKPQKKKKGKEKTRESSCCNPEKEEGESKGEMGWRQTSLKTMMSQKSQIQGRLRARNKVADVKDKLDGCPLAKLSPFKEVLHDHEYVKIDPLRFPDSVFVIPQERKVESAQIKSEKITKQELNDVENFKREIKSECEIPEEAVPESLKQSEPEVLPAEKESIEEECGTLHVKRIHDSQLKLTEEKALDDAEIITETLIRRGIKRMRVDEDLPNKRIKLDVEDQQEEKLPLEITEKENLEERSVPREKAGCSPMKTMSRALRMIALVPESTKGGQIQREATPRVEILKSKKGPNVDRSSRASKMLALLSENVAEIEDVSDVRIEDDNSWGDPVTTPNTKTPASSLKSPKSIKKRRSIRFDDAKNETVLYQIDTPPSQILEEKEKCRRIKLAEITVNLP